MVEQRGGFRNARRAAVVEEAVLQRTRIEHLLDQEHHLDVVQTHSGIGPFLAWLRDAEQSRWPHLLVLGLPARGDATTFMNVVARLRRAGIRVVAVTSSASRSIAAQLMADGVDGLVSTTDSEVEFLTVVEKVLGGRAVATTRARADAQRLARGPRLSLQEERVLALYATGLTIAEVAERIGVRQDTARKYLNRVRDKFTTAGWPARSKLQLARIAWAEGYADPEIGGNFEASGPIVTVAQENERVTAG